MPFLLLANWQGFYSPIDPQINPYMCLDMTYPPTKFDIDWSKETQVMVKKPNVSVFSKLARILQSDWPPNQSPRVFLWRTHLQSLMLIDQRKIKLP